MKKPKPAEKPKNPDDLPLKPALEELAFVRKAFHDAVARYAARIDEDLLAVREVLAAIGAQKKIPRACVKDLRDVLMILRETEVKPQKGRRRDLRKVESAVKEMRLIIDEWD